MVQMEILDSSYFSPFLAIFSSKQQMPDMPGHGKDLESLLL